MFFLLVCSVFFVCSDFFCVFCFLFCVFCFHFVLCFLFCVIFLSSAFVVYVLTPELRRCHTGNGESSPGCFGFRILRSLPSSRGMHVTMLSPPPVLRTVANSISLSWGSKGRLLAHLRGVHRGVRSARDPGDSQGGSCTLFRRRVPLGAGAPSRSRGRQGTLALGVRVTDRS